MNRLRLGSPQFKLLQRLCGAASVSGDETEVRAIVLEAVKPHASEVRVDPMGSVLVLRKGKGRRRPRVLLDAHMDEVGLMILGEAGRGLYHFADVGGIPKEVLQGKQVLVGRDHRPGVIGAAPWHLNSGEGGLPDASSLTIDLGPEGKAQPGERAVFDIPFRRSGPSIMARAIDDRVGVAILIELLKAAPDTIDLCLSFSAQEEVHLRGARTAARAFEPDLAIAIDATPARDLPSADRSENSTYNTRLGQGPAIYTVDRRTVHDPALVGFIQRTAEAADIPYQMRQPGGGSTDAAAIQGAGGGVRVVSVSVPHRYTHSPASLMRAEDWSNTLNLLYLALKRITPGLVSELS